MAMKACPKCQEEFNGSRALKEHMSTTHGGYTSADIPSDTANQAKSILGSNSLAELAAGAPSDDATENVTGLQANGTEPARRGRPKKTAEEQEAQKKRALAMERIGGVICRKTASLPYAFWARLAADDSLHLKIEEQKELADAYLEICRGYDADFSSPFMGVLAAIAINAEFVAKRLGLDMPEGNE